MKYLILTIFITTQSFAQSSYSAANQDSDTNAKNPTHLDTGYANKDAENHDMNFSGEMGNANVESGPELQEDVQNANYPSGAKKKK